MSIFSHVTYIFPHVTFFSDVHFSIFFKSTNRRSKRINLCQKKIGHQPRLGENDPSKTRLPNSAVSLSLSDWNDTLASARLSLDCFFARV